MKKNTHNIITPPFKIKAQLLKHDLYRENTFKPMALSYFRRHDRTDVMFTSWLKPELFQSIPI